MRKTLHGVAKRSLLLCLFFLAISIWSVHSFKLAATPQSWVAATNPAFHLESPNVTPESVSAASEHCINGDYKIRSLQNGSYQDSIQPQCAVEKPYGAFGTGNLIQFSLDSRAYRVANSIVPVAVPHTDRLVYISGYNLFIYPNAIANLQESGPYENYEKSFTFCGGSPCNTPPVAALAAQSLAGGGNTPTGTRTLTAGGTSFGYSSASVVVR